MAYNLSKSHQVRSTKPKKIKKQTKKKVKTPMPEGEYVCVGCGATKYLEIHHVFFGNKYYRDNSSLYHCVEWLDYTHHRGQPDGVHGGNKKLDLQLKQKHQFRLEQNGMCRSKFIELFGRSYLEED